MTEITIRPLEPADQGWLTDFLTAHWGSRLMVSRGRLFDVSTHSGWAAFNEQHEIAGLLTYDSLSPDSCEVTCLESIQESRGIGTRLLHTLFDYARTQGWQHVWLITTNDNMNALRFYQKRGFVLKALYPNALEISRQLKAEIPAIGYDKIPIRDEIELEYSLA